MRHTRLQQKWMAYLFLVALVGGMWPGIILGPGRAEGLVTPPDMPIMPIGVTVGVIQGQMVRLSFQNLSTETVQVEFALVNFQGDNLTVGPIEILGPGKGTFVDIPGSAILGKNDTRAEVTGFVRVFASPKALKAAKTLWMAASLQVLDETTHGTVLILPYINIAGAIGPIM